MKVFDFVFILLCVATVNAIAADRPVSIRFQAQVGDQPFACGRQYQDIGLTKSTIKGQDFRFYVSNVRFTDAAGKETPVDLDQDGKWQVDDLALLDFEDGTAGCSNGTPEMNTRIVGKAPEGRYTGLRFTMGVPFGVNHADPLQQPSPLNLTALFWVWNAGHKFARIEFASTGAPRGFMVHLGSTGCSPHDTRLTIPTSCLAPNRVEVNLPSFDISKDAVIADLAALLQNTNVDSDQNKAAEAPAMGGEKAREGMKMASRGADSGMGMMMGPGCMSGPNDANCAGLFLNFGLPFGSKPASGQRFFRAAKASSGPSTRASR